MGVTLLKIKFDGRAVAIAFLVAYFCALASMYAFDVPRPWRFLGVNQASPPFIDLDNVLTAVDCHRLGLDTLVLNPCDSLGRPLDYPRVWLALGALGASHAWLLPAGIALGLAVLCTVLACFGRLSIGGGIVAGAALLSPSFMYLIERGNIDEIILVLVAASAVLAASTVRTSRWIAVAIVAFAAILKLYPVAASVATLAPRGKLPAYRRWSGVAFTVGLFAAYLAATWRDVLLIVRLVPASVGESYGAGVLSGGLGDALQFQAVPRPVTLGIGLAVISCGSILGLVSAARGVAPPSWTANARGRLFAAGAAIYVATFCLGHNYAYRLAFVLLTIPALLEWGTAKNLGGVASRALLGVTLAVLYLAPLGPILLPPVFYLWVLGQVAGWLLAFGFAWCLAAGAELVGSPAATGD